MIPDTKNGLNAQATVNGRELPPTLAPLRELSWNYWWSWAPDGSEIFRDLDPNLWQQCEQNPRLLLTQISDLRLAEIATDPLYLERVERLNQRFNKYVSETR